LLGRFPDLIFDVVGDGDARPDLEALAREQGVAHAVRFHGTVSEEELTRLYENAGIYVMPSSGEGFGLVFVEAMAHGLPVVAGAEDAAREVVVDKETGYLVPSGSDDALVEAIASLLGDDDLRRRMGRAGRARVEDVFSFPVFRDALVAELAEVVTS
jgi:phosphatidylinositol alpha-1,6-mannosyltransferase